MFKRLLAFLLVATTCLPLMTVSGQKIYVATDGNDNWPGTLQQPRSTLHAALRQAREMRRLNDPAITNGIHVFLKGGAYFLEESVLIRPEDAGTLSSPTIIEAMPGAEPILSGGIKINGFKKLVGMVAGLSKTAQNKLWVADLVPNGNGYPSFRQLWINNKKAVRAKHTNGDTMQRILSWNKRDQTCWIPTPSFSALEKSHGIEMFIHQWWAVATLRVKKMEVSGDSTRLYFHQPESRVQSEHPWPAPWVSSETGNSAFYLTNALQFLDEPGEWWLDVTKGKLYYWPRTGENLHNATVIAPSLEALVKIEGTADHPVNHISFNGISFNHTGWLRPSQLGHVPHQAGMYMLDAYSLKKPGTTDKKTLENQAWVGRPAAAVSVNFAGNIQFNDCQFQHLASTGLDYHKGVVNSQVNGSLFTDIGGTGILAGVYADEATEIHLPYNPKDEREITTGITISNNLVSNVTNEDWGCVGIGAGYTRNTTIRNNEIEEVGYSAISLGWGWTPTPNAMRNNAIIANKIHHYGKHNYDCAGIYTLSAQPGSRISENYIDSIYKAPYAHLPTHWFYLYTDEGSSHFTITDNWTPARKYLQNANGPGNTWNNNGPMVSNAIKAAAGLTAGYAHLAAHKSNNLGPQPISTMRNEVIELVVPEGSPINLVKLKQLLLQNDMDTAGIYQWQNHYLLFSKVTDINVMQGRLKNNFPEATVKVYHDLFYEFNRNMCPDKTTAAEWEHTILTANLVADKDMQQEYLRYHATQLQQWPEMSKGFCNADFQQLLLFKNGRQMVLVISIPKGQSLDQLNPRTTANNPRVTDWNNLMKKYQEGIPGTKKGTTWVQLEQVP